MLWSCSACLGVGSSLKSAELFLVASDVFGGDFECGSQGGEACGSGGSVRRLFWGERPPAYPRAPARVPARSLVPVHEHSDEGSGESCSLHHPGDADRLMPRMSSGSDGTEAVQHRNPHRRNEVAVAGATD